MYKDISMTKNSTKEGRKKIILEQSFCRTVTELCTLLQVNYNLIFFNRVGGRSMNRIIILVEIRNPGTSIQLLGSDQ